MKAGDRVEIVATDYLARELSNGQQGVVKKIEFCSDGTPVYQVIMDNGHLDLLGDPFWNFYEHQLGVI